MDGCLLPQWPVSAPVSAPLSAQLGALLSCRHSGRNALGRSTCERQAAAPYAHCNLALHVGDDAVAVHRNRAWLASISSPAVYLRQVHGHVCVPISAHEWRAHANPAALADTLTADAAWTCARQLACCVMVADCLAVLFASPDGQRVAAAHVGWRGLAAGVLENTVRALSPPPPRDAHAGPTAAPILAWLSPCIGPQAFEVGAEVIAALAADNHRVIVAGHSARGRPLLDLAATARTRLQRLGVTCYGNDSSAAWCTYSQPDRFYSYRYASERDHPTGRMAAFIWKR